MSKTRVTALGAASTIWRSKKYDITLRQFPGSTIGRLFKMNERDAIRSGHGGGVLIDEPLAVKF